MPVGAARLRIPATVERFLLDVQPRLRRLTPDAQRRSVLGRLLNFRSAIELVPVPLDRELAFWRIEDDEELEQFLFDKLLAAMPPHDMKGRWRGLPAGYRPLLNVLQFEVHRQFDGWTAVTNVGRRVLRELIDDYGVLGLKQEATALRRVLAEYESSRASDDDVEDRLERAYAAGRKPPPDFDDRVAMILAFVRGHATLFGSSAP